VRLWLARFILPATAASTPIFLLTTTYSLTTVSLVDQFIQLKAINGAVEAISFLLFKNSKVTGWCTGLAKTLFEQCVRRQTPYKLASVKRFATRPRRELPIPLLTRATTGAGLEALRHAIDSIAPQVSPFVAEKLHNPLSYHHILGMRSFVPVTFE
jgi:hypothetical protein